MMKMIKNFMLYVLGRNEPPKYNKNLYSTTLVMQNIDPYKFFLYFIKIRILIIFIIILLFLFFPQEELTKPLYQNFLNPTPRPPKTNFFFFLFLEFIDKIFDYFPIITITMLFVSFINKYIILYYMVLNTFRSYLYSLINYRIIKTVIEPFLANIWNIHRLERNINNFYFFYLNKKIMYFFISIMTLTMVNFHKTVIWPLQKNIKLRILFSVYSSLTYTFIFLLIFQIIIFFTYKNLHELAYCFDDLQIFIEEFFNIYNRFFPIQLYNHLNPYAENMMIHSDVIDYNFPNIRDHPPKITSDLFIPICIGCLVTSSIIIIIKIFN